MMSPARGDAARPTQQRLFETILVGFDGSDTGHDALRLATGLAKASGARVVIGFVFDAALTASSMAAAAELLEHAEATLASARASVSQGLNVAFQAAASHSPAAGIQQLASDHHANLIVVGSRGLGPATRIALGSVSHQVVVDARCPVAVAPRGYREHGGYVPQAIGVTAGAGGQPSGTVALADALAATTGGAVHIVTVGPEASDEASHLSARDVEVSSVAHADELAGELIRRSFGLDLIVISSGSGADGGSDLETMALDIIERSRCPVLIIPAIPVNEQAASS